MDRRTLLRGGLVSLGGVATSSLVSCTPPADPAPIGPFDCGVASGVHSESAVVLWTRFAPAALDPVSVRWQVAADPAFGSVVAGGSREVTPDTDGCCKVLAEGLRAGTAYWYRFEVDGLWSPIGRTRTLPDPESSPAEVRLAVASCQQYKAGYYTAWRAIAEDDLDAVVFLGDYIYESGSVSPLDLRLDGVGPAVDLPSYRAKYRLYRGDPDLQAAHAAHPFATVWDDHEFVDNCNRLTLLEQASRGRAAYRAWWEYQPVWPLDGDRIYRNARWGRLVDLALLDTRQYRDPQPSVAGSEIPVGATTDPLLRVVHREGRTILGVDQRDWLLDGLSAAQDDGVTWKLVGNQVMVSPIRLVDLDEPSLRGLDPDLPKHAGVYVNFDDWDGYHWERDVLTNHLFDGGVSNVGFLTGDVHSFWQAPMRRDFDEDRSPIVGQEFVCGSVTSRGVDYAGDLAPELGRAVAGTRPGFRFVDFVHRGYGHVTCTPDRSVVEFRGVNAVSRRGARRRLARFDWSLDTQQVAITRG